MRPSTTKAQSPFLILNFDSTSPLQSPAGADATSGQRTPRTMHDHSHFIAIISERGVQKGCLSLNDLGDGLGSSERREQTGLLLEPIGEKRKNSLATERGIFRTYAFQVAMIGSESMTAISSSASAKGSSKMLLTLKLHDVNAEAPGSDP